MAKKSFDDDDGRVIADMSDIGRQPLVIPRFDRLNREKKHDNATENEASEPWKTDDISKQEKRSFIAGALCATALVVAIFATVGALVIFLISRMG